MEAPVLRLREGETALVGYGSLLSVASISKTLKQPYTGPFLFCRIKGWRRSWDAGMPNEAFYYEENGARVYPRQIVYLNVRPEPASTMNCVVFVVTAAQLQEMHEREWIYHATMVTADLRDVRIEGGEALIYVARQERLVRDMGDPHTAAVRSSYLRIVERALREVEPRFRTEYESSTDSVPEHLVVEDRLDPERPSPWAAAGYAYTPEQ